MFPLSGCLVSGVSSLAPWRCWRSAHDPVWTLELTAAPLWAVFLIIGMTRLSVVEQRKGRRLGIAMLWEAVVYGIAEGLLLSACPS